MASRSPSPRKLNPITAMTMATEGAASVHQAVAARELESETISPNDAVGGGGVIEIAGCGGWSKRQTLFGSDQASGREDRLLDPLR